MIEARYVIDGKLMNIKYERGSMDGVEVVEIGPTYYDGAGKDPVYIFQINEQPFIAETPDSILTMTVKEVKDS